MINRDWYDANKHLVAMKQSTRYPELYVLKYKRKVFFDNLWTPELELCRGLIVDKDFNIVVRPFRKIFNYMENGTTFDRDEQVVYTRKVNGSLGCVTNTEKYGTLFSTTGSLDSDFAQRVEKHLKGRVEHLSRGLTFCFEICDESDPHIITEDVGAYLIGVIDIVKGWQLTEHTLDHIAALDGFKRYSYGDGRFSNVVQLSKYVNHEGFVVRLARDQQQALKIKTPYYLVKKFFARKTVDKLSKLLDNPAQAKQYVKDEEYFTLVDYLCKEKDKFVVLDEQQRLRFIEEYLHG